MEKKNEKIITDWWIKEGFLSLEEYKKRGGFDCLKKALQGEFTKENILTEIEKSGLQGRGGSGFPTGRKWRMSFEAIKKAQKEGNKKAYFICNADESEPGTYKDRFIIEKSPYLLLEGILLGAFTVGAETGYIYINGSYKDTAFLLKKIIRELKSVNLLGEKILGSEFNFDLKVFEGAGSYVCGEETALINSIEGKRGEPRQKPPYPLEKGLFGLPTLVNNVETLAFVPFILEKGASAFKLKSRSQNSFGTKMFILSGSVNNPGVYEAPLGVTTKELIYDYAGGVPKGQKVRCFQIGGSSGRLHPESDLESPLGFSGEQELPVGSGSILVIPDNFDLKKLVLAWASFFRRESCGKCVPCREGTYQLYLMAERLQNGRLTSEDLVKIGDIIFTMQKASFCPFGSFATNGFESFLRLFPEEVKLKL